MQLYRNYFYVFVITFSMANGSNVIDVRGKTLSRGTERGMAYAKFKAHKYSYLNITRIGSDYVMDGKECGLACVNTPSCFSFNLAAFHDIVEKLLCELLPSDMYNNSDKFVASKSHHHFGITSPCISWPCQNDGTCVAQYQKDSYLCVCGKGYTGKHCEMDIKCAEDPHSCDVNAHCANTAGSYRCTCKPNYYGNGETCRPIVDSCHNYSKLSEPERKSNHVTPESGPVYCDDQLSEGWYRFMGAAGTKMPTTRVPAFRCGADWSGWLNGAHPSVEDGEVLRTVCLSNRETGCKGTVDISVKYCGSYFIYKLHPLPVCNSRYCGTD